MRSHCALYVDVGYLLASAATRLTGTSLRSGIEVRYAPLVEALIAGIEQESKLPLLRVNWYDAARDGVPTTEQKAIALLPHVKLRLGRLSHDGGQKGVDLRIGLDLVAHSRKGAVEIMYLLSGDDDLCEAVEEAQAQGVEVRILAVPNSSGRAHGVSDHLQRAADDMSLVSADTLDAAIKVSAKTITDRVAAAIAPRPSLAAAPVGGRETTPDPAKPSRPLGVATPSDMARLLARSRPAVDAPAADEPVAQVPDTPLYSSTTGGTSSYARQFEHDTDEIAGEVITRVLATWLSTATPREREELAAGRPSIPRDIDSTLLRDMAEGLGVYDVPDDIRFRLRRAFWDGLDNAVAEPGG